MREKLDDSVNLNSLKHLTTTHSHIRIFRVITMTIIARYAEPISIDHGKDSKKSKGKNRRKNQKYGRGILFPWYQYFSHVISKISTEHDFKELYSNFQSIYSDLPRKIRKINRMSFTTITIIITMEFIDKHKCKRSMNQKG